MENSIEQQEKSVEKVISESTPQLRGEQIQMHRDRSWCVGWTSEKSSKWTWKRERENFHFHIIWEILCFNGKNEADIENAATTTITTTDSGNDMMQIAVCMCLQKASRKRYDTMCRGIRMNKCENWHSTIEQWAKYVVQWRRVYSQHLTLLWINTNRFQLSTNKELMATKMFAYAQKIKWTLRTIFLFGIFHQIVTDWNSKLLLSFDCLLNRSIIADIVVIFFNCLFFSCLY